MKRLLTGMLFGGLLALPGTADAQQPYFYSGIPDAEQYLDFLGGSGVNGGYGVQVGPYKGAFTDPASPMFSIYCVDYTHYARDQWVNVTALNSGDLSNTRLEDYGDYRKAAYLASLFDTAPKTEWGYIHAAIWQITSGVYLANPNDPNAIARRQYYYGLAGTESGSFSTQGWYVVSPSNPYNVEDSKLGQEFLMRTVSVPEPATFLLLASGLLCLAAVSRKRLPKAGDA